ncbi:beta-1,4-glucuronyltransferase 1-like isoform X2 [Anthonomus grandis grandis]|uniref:beta-1,4-glucuronyltransferase 1-like isoform X1 n=1 Tax=Anthonomus grandis grandis TaxID=2921223 RepID=UPI002165A3B1|nr:beta-1,4-glucuronyltransferase 1-like isoform X1 [Anthonomus grandis grandis]XP_050308608.1 beta-1,4-glucuronyltransferase 1-like isoform X1 [Anthonomus grandis grandis]XP_050308609.1 beta-1,4-glucuronyltransferase 1-like isoform X1 [Anthonomus grandis grandis]XP_050308610.1 beta-1,4-glucuronyltransferase 1-like isoform X1 [Anthonomus grandis grandis]XP_050308611.1 beta-1,4-glucuronyltransferase 1-like isoform X2 [Anthonomus grandis grandis]
MYNNRKSFIIKIFVILCLIYIAVHVLFSSGEPVIRELQQSGRSLAGLDGQNVDAVALMQDAAIQLTTSNASRVPQPREQLAEVKPSEAPPALKPEPTVEEKVKLITNCLDRPTVPKTQQRGDYWVLYNYVRAERTFKCEETVTYTTHADFSFMDNLVPLLERWRGPISIALHAPGTDFPKTLESIAHLRDCTSALVRELVTFHIYFSTKHVPKEVPKHTKVFEEPYNCSLTPPYLNVSSDQMYKAQKKLLYPVNVGRNVAREMAQTHYILPSDIELYPSPNISTKFLEMVATNVGPLLSKNPKVYVLHIFEVSANSQVPETKTMLKEMLMNGTALPFHKKLCPGCHNIPKAKEWQLAPETQGLHIFHVGKRNGRFIHWEPIFIGTHNDPLYDERLSWEGKSDKMTQGYALCVLNYDFMILDNAFLVHKPGIKVYKKDAKRAMLAGKTNQLIKKIIFPELKVLYGVRKGCAV